MSTTDITNTTNCILEELKLSTSPKKFLNAYKIKTTRKHAPHTKYISDLSFIINGKTWWGIIGGCASTSFETTIKLINDIKWSDCDIETNPITREVTVHVKKPLQIAA